MKFVIIFLCFCTTAKTPIPSFNQDKIIEIRQEIGYLMLDKQFRMKPASVIDSKIQELQKEIIKLQK